MKDKFINFFNKIYNLKNKIAFFPSIIALAGCIFAYIMMYLENEGISKYILEFFPELVISNTETARTILTTFIAGLISIMVFSFSMVMILLNQASSNFSPRLLPGLISNRRHQIVLGIYLFTIIYCIFILVFIEPTGDKYQLPGFSVLLSILFMLNSLAAFIYFIHSISQEIQIDNILFRIYDSAEKKLTKLIDIEKNLDKELPNTKNWIEYKVKTTGYFQIVSLKTLAKIAKENNFKIEIIATKGSFCDEDDILFKTEKEIEEDIENRIYNNFHFSKSELIDDNYLLAFKQITEVAVKSMSPGINDPGTAINAIDYLSQLLILRIQKIDVHAIKDNNEILLIVHTLEFEKLIYNIMVSLRTYCSHDFIIVIKLLSVLKRLSKKTTNKSYKKVINFEVNNLLTDSKNKINNSTDLEKVENYALSFIEV
ncbi:DUF2254 domain-containing protein [Polaribacter pectinis]|uniref:DUF2254 domain-containing protein n=1 Tax=Polaribacter pectinis TaxID=2738844 RepID=A0A7G9LC60_9FLAO|nr:DUF2254 domain-containing protein [Polaribacter pectinis]QNM86209.1 DUF2254 domain-containing protein [Polaribacter pectinis]